MDKASHLAHVRADAAALAAAARTAPDAPIPTCPGWAMPDLVTHVGQVHQWVAVTVETRAVERVSRRDLPGLPSGADLLPAFEAGTERLLAALDGIGPDDAVWNWTAHIPQTGAFWHRRMAQETAVHRADAEAGAGTAASTLDGALAVDGIDELLFTILPTLLRATESSVDLDGSLHLHATDRDGEWLVAVTDGALSVERSHGKGDAALRGTASDLYLWATNRAPIDRLECFGDEAIPARWTETMRF